MGREELEERRGCVVERKREGEMKKRKRARG